MKVDREFLAAGFSWPQPVEDPDFSDEPERYELQVEPSEYACVAGRLGAWWRVLAESGVQLSTRLAPPWLNQPGTGDGPWLSWLSARAADDWVHTALLLIPGGGVVCQLGVGWIPRWTTFYPDCTCLRCFAVGAVPVLINLDEFLVTALLPAVTPEELGTAQFRPITGFP